jgi:predicted transcriptional regulator
MRIAVAKSRRRSSHWQKAIHQYLDHEEEIERCNREADEAWEHYHDRNS